MTQGQQSHPAGIRWGWFHGCVAAGLLLVGGALFGEAQWDWEGVVPTALVDAGVALGLAGVLVLLGQRFTGTVVRESQHAARETAEEIGARFEQRASGLSARIDQLQTEVTGRLRERTERQNAKIEALEDNLSYRTVAEAMTEANKLQAIHKGQLTVPAARQLDVLALTFSWGADDDRHRSPGPHLDIAAERRGGSDPIVVEWMPNADAVDVAEELVHELQAAGIWEGEGTLDWPLTLSNLKHGLDLAISARRRDPGRWTLNGTLIEVIDDNWVLTDAGPECPERDYVLSQGKFPPPPNFLTGNTRRPPGDPALLQPPEWATQEEWERVIRRAHRIFPIRRSADPAGPLDTWRPWAGSLPEHGP